MRVGLRALIAATCLSLLAQARSDAGPPATPAPDRSISSSRRGERTHGPASWPTRARTTGRSRRSAAPVKPSGRLLRTLDRPRPVRVVLRAGTYYLDSPLEFGPEDSGTRNAPVVYAAAAGEKVTLSGGRRLEGGRWGEVNGRKAWIGGHPRGEGRELAVPAALRRRRAPAADEAAEARGIPDRIAARLHRRLPPEPDQAVRLRPGRHRARLAQPPGRGGRRDHEMAGQPAADRERRREVAHRHLRPPEPVRPPLRRQARALLGGERRRGPGHARPVVSRSPAGDALLPAATGGGDARRPRSSPRGCRRSSGSSGAQAPRSTTSASRASPSPTRNGSRRPTMPRRSRPGSKCPARCCSTTPSDASSPAAASSTSAITASRWASAARTSRSPATGSPISARGRSASATSSPGRPTAPAD